MRKAERLFQIITLLRGRRTVITAEQLAEKLEVSERTIYRDIHALMHSGMHIESEAGVGYRLKPKFDIPPLMFEPDELEALLLGARMVQGWGSDSLGKAAETALQKIHSVLPEELHRLYVQQQEWLIVPDYHRKRSARHADVIRNAIKNQIKLILDYQDEDKNPSERTVLPLGLIYWGSAWTLVAWCELRDNYRMFRLDRISQIKSNNESFTTSDNCNLQDYISKQK